MVVFTCVRCDAVLTRPVERVALPARAHQTYGHELLPALMESGTYAVDPEPFGLPYRPWSEIGAEAAAERGVFAPVHRLSFAAPGAVVVAPGDTRGTVLIPERCDGYCMGLDGRDGPNLACERCGSAVATRIDDCSLWQTVWFVPDAVRRVPDGDACAEPEDAGADWDALAQEYGAPPPVEPYGGWDAQWEAAVGAALAHLLAASAGAPVALPDGILTDTFGRALDALLPPGPAARRLVPAGPGLPAAVGDPDIALVPWHPRTGEVWRPSDPEVAVVPLEADVWLGVAFPRVQLPVPATGGLPDGVYRDDPLPLYPTRLFAPDRRVFLHTLARLPAVRAPWLRAVYDLMEDAPFGEPF
ncbi:hypothetical protein [Streptomyces sp. Je 1-369]|uniref:hypothetical protein n=1 Tax=Streptomyces sp. Je 1-369 TaxID=2966192 RepID=UPI002285DEB4|nr:hypothetical protein [Streptomyces sp. Je 1-369]WAL94676.1 hypothetical protein NOO62_09300 [Streptomyces sp. Je 1-369]